MKPMEAYVKKWYDALEEGRIMGMKCKRCGAYEFPPVPVCNSCSGTDLEWVEMKGEGEMVSFSATTLVDPVFAEYGPTLNAVVQLVEGPTFISWLVGSSIGQENEIYRKLPALVKMEIHKREKYKYPVFRIAE